ncbi:MAG: hypothetical protein AB1720_12470, partial [Pseudomonadota bacterium]
MLSRTISNRLFVVKRVLSLGFFSLSAITGLALADDSRTQLLDQVVKKVANQRVTSDPRKIALWHRPIRPEQLVLQRVARQSPNKQISSALPGVTAELEYQLLFETEKYYRFDPFDPLPNWNSPNIEYLGTVGKNDFSRIEGALVIQLGEVVFNANESLALTYAESASFEKRVGNAAPRPRVKGGRSPAERTLDVRNREIRWPVAGCG